MNDQYKIDNETNERLVLQAIKGAFIVGDYLATLRKLKYNPTIALKMQEHPASDVLSEFEELLTKQGEQQCTSMKQLNGL